MQVTRSRGLAPAFPSTLALVWLFLALLAGPVTGLAGHSTRRDSWPGAASTAAISGIFLGESLFVAFTATSPDRWPLVLLDLGAGLLLPALLPTKRHGRLHAYALLPLAAIAAMALLQMLRSAILLILA
jgi:hypothetical protein